MTSSETSRAGAHLTIRPDWLAKRREDPLEPELPIVDPHHHLWDRPGNRYLLPDILADIGEGHAVRATVFIECHAMYRAARPEERRSIAETEFGTGIAPRSDSAQYARARSGPTRESATGCSRTGAPRCAGAPRARTCTSSSAASACR